ncbi:Alpha/Beta hydrolase protein [Mucor mucedo]|uniref:Alpha/Beta hydrolase protein n=1 Tax=Mucor mucedo TaxID=29922 RepID=UPI002220581F|nr:Alpha/Beta hydrolase protein [Mucor mucedo]KAI7890957.1 Alpha/Beta hydrolase protein [Mucor mucedo]
MKTFCYGPVENDPLRSIDFYESEKKSQVPLFVLHPDHMLDVGKALEYLYKTPNASYDHEKIYMIGHSAGGHMATMFMVDTSLPYHRYLAGIVSISGIHDIPLLVKTFPSYLDFIEQAFGPDNHHDASPVSKFSGELKKGKPIVIAHSMQDTLVNLEQAHVMVNHLKSMGANVTLDTSIVGDHYDIMNKGNLIPLLSFISNCDV